MPIVNYKQLPEALLIETDEGCIRGEGGVVVGLPEPDDELAKSFVYFKDKYFISLYRTFFGGFGDAQGIIKTIR